MLLPLIAPIISYKLLFFFGFLGHSTKEIIVIKGWLRTGVVRGIQIVHTNKYRSHTSIGIVDTAEKKRISYKNNSGIIVIMLFLYIRSNSLTPQNRPPQYHYIIG